MAQEDGIEGPESIRSQSGPRSLEHGNGEQAEDVEVVASPRGIEDGIGEQPEAAAFNESGGGADEGDPAGIGGGVAQGWTPRDRGDAK
jgi:hypothetical protein